MKNTILIASAATLLLAACSKNDSTPALTTSQKILGSWTLTAHQLTITTNGTPLTPTDSFANQDNCTKNDVYNFISGGLYIVTEGATKCRTSDPDTISTGLFTLDQNDARLILKNADGSPRDTVDIVEITNTSLRTKKDRTISGPGLTTTSSNQKTYTKK